MKTYTIATIIAIILVASGLLISLWSQKGLTVHTSTTSIQTTMPTTSIPTTSIPYRPAKPLNVNFTMPGDSSTNTSIFLTQHIDDLANSDWMHYQPIVGKVANLTEGQNTDWSKARAIAPWVATSRPYNFSEANSHNYNNISIANRKLSVIQIYNEQSGVCYDSAVIATAMLRLAGIPSRVLYPYGSAHAITEAYLDGKWVPIDPTFNSAGPSYNASVLPLTASPVYVGKFNNTENYFTDYFANTENFSGDIYKFVVTYNNLSQGYVIYPKIAEGITGDLKSPINDSLSNSFIAIRMDRADNKSIWCFSGGDCVLSDTKPLDRCNQGGQIGVCEVATQINQNVFLNNILFEVVQDKNTKEYSTANLAAMVYVATSRIPTGQYRFSIMMRNGIGIGSTSQQNSQNLTADQSQEQEIAYAIVNITANKTITITPNMLIKGQNVTQMNYNDLMKRLEMTGIGNY